MKRATNTRLRIRQSAGQIEQTPVVLDEVIPSKEVIQMPPPSSIFKDVLEIDSSNLVILKNATEKDLSVVSKLVVRNVLPEMNEVLKRKFLQDVGILFRKDGDKESKEIRMLFDDFWKYSIRLPMFNSGTTLEIENCFLYPAIHLFGTRFDTFIISYDDDMFKRIKIPVMNLNPNKDSLLERIVVGRNVVIDCSGLDIETLVCINVLSYMDTLSSANSIRKIIILTEMNPVRDADPERGDMCVEFPLPNGIHTLFVPEAQEFLYNHYAIQRSSLKFVGIIPSVYYPGRAVIGIQKTWQPIHRESLEQEFVNIIRNI